MVSSGDENHSYKGAPFLVDKGCSIQAVIDLPENDAVFMKYLDAYARNFDIEAENSVLKHTGPGILSMIGKNRLFISTKKVPRLKYKYVVFGQVIQGMKLVRVIESQPSFSYGPSAPKKDCRIYACGQLPMETTM
ncbi:unnamed protein product [Microthlaspi erraticum]|uniref:PPIase cyclophilin-type domain-containing protein n=1 Tax=Microthlaspi erraticum TaxID=1685480 RepID=A0A6D2HN97_9BRAS|nr:unnamed protein product [Microthlaspi erraticum]